MRSVRRLATAGLALVITASLAVPAVAAPNDQDVVWLQAAHRSNLAEIAAGTAAQQEATTDTVKDLGAMFVQMHTELDAALVPVAEELGVELDAEPTAEQQAQLAAVQANDGQAFDTAWIAQQLGSHRASQAATEQELAQGSDEQVLTLARTTAPVVAQHLAQLQAAAAQYGVPAGVPGGSGGGLAAASPLSPLATGLVGSGVALVLASALVLTVRRRTA